MPKKRNLTNRGSEPTKNISKKKFSRRVRTIYIICGSIFAVCFMGIIILLFYKEKRPSLPFTLTADTSKLDRYMIKFLTRDVSQEESNNATFGYFDMENLTFSNSIDTAICFYPECPNASEAEGINIVFSNAIFKVYRIDNLKTYLTEYYFDGEKHYRLLNSSNHQVIGEFDSVSSLMEYLQKYLVLDVQNPENLTLVTSNSINQTYSVKLFSDYLELFQRGFYTDCKIVIGFNNNSGSDTTSSVHEECPINLPSQKLNIKLNISVGNPVIIKSEGTSYLLPNGLSVRDSDSSNYLVIVESSEDTLVTTSENIIDFYSIGHHGNGYNPDGGISIPKAEVSLYDLTGDLIYGRNSFSIPPYSTLNTNGSDMAEAFINRVDVISDLFQRAHTIQVKGLSREIILNNESLSPYVSQELENFRSLAIPLLTAIMTSIITFILGLLIGKQAERIE